MATTKGGGGTGDWRSEIRQKSRIWSAERKLSFFAQTRASHCHRLAFRGRRSRKTHLQFKILKLQLPFSPPKSVLCAGKCPAVRSPGGSPRANGHRRSGHRRSGGTYWDAATCGLPQSHRPVAFYQHPAPNYCSHCELLGFLPALGVKAQPVGLAVDASAVDGGRRRRCCVWRGLDDRAAAEAAQPTTRRAVGAQQSARGRSGRKRRLCCVWVGVGVGGWGRGAGRRRRRRRWLKDQGLAGDAAVAAVGGRGVACGLKCGGWPWRRAAGGSGRAMGSGRKLPN